jgi:hippurate hydrolase
MIKSYKSFFISLYILVSFSITASAQSADLDKKITSYIQSSYARLFELYKQLHANPELSFQEKNTAATIAGQLKNLGYEVTRTLVDMA